MRAPVVEVTDILGQDLLEMVLVENQQVIQALGPNRPHPSFRDGVGARRSERRANLCNAEIPHPPIETCAVDSVTVMNEEARRPSIPSAAFHNLLCRPCGSRGRRYVDIDNLPVRMMDHEEDVECPKEDRLHAEEIARPDGGGVLFQEWPPARRMVPGLENVFAHRKSGDGAALATRPPCTVPAAAAKAGVHALVKNLAIELAPEKIRVNAIAPAVIETPIYGTFLAPEQVKAVLPSFNAFHPLGRNGQAADAAEALLFLASDQASFITGVVLPVDGGVMAGRQ
jgi:Enoyl-(Acyl carrier protein) reductase